jgi:hypothetical protein
MVMTVEFWKSSGEAAIKAAAAAALAVIGTDQLISAMAVDWTQVVGVALLAGVVSILTHIVVPTPEVRAAKREAVRFEAEKAEAAAKAAADKAAKPARKTTKKA